MRLCGGVIAHNADFKLKKVYSGASLTKYHIQCHAADGSRIVGRGGERFRAFRLLMMLAGHKMGRRISLDTVEKDTVGKPEQFENYKYNPQWPRDAVRNLFVDVCKVVLTQPAQVKLVEDGKTAILELRHDPRDSSTLESGLLLALENIFEGIGTTNGCQLSIDSGVA